MSHSQPANFFDLLTRAQIRLDSGFSRLPHNTPADLDSRAEQVLEHVADRLHDNYPYAHPLYAGQMLKPPHPIARAAYALAMSVNPNNHALDGGRASSAMEMEAVAQLAAMFGLPQHIGHLSSGGTFANLEALWVAGQLNPGKAIVASDQAHYTHSRVAGVLQLPFTSISTDDYGRMDLRALEETLDSGNVGTVVATLGTTAIGAVDPLDAILKLQRKYTFRIHVDAAYGGYFTLVDHLDAAARRAFDAIPFADSIVIDPHKHGLQPYGCGAVLFRDPAVGRLYKHDSPYTYFSSKDLHLGEISLECSRAGASAVALWATQQLLPYVRDGDFAKDLTLCRRAALELRRLLASEGRFLVPIASPQLDIVFWAVSASTPEDSSALAQAIFDKAAALDLHLALANLPVRFFHPHSWPDVGSAKTVTCLRSVLMKPDHLHWMEEIWKRLSAAAAGPATGISADQKS